MKIEKVLNRLMLAKEEGRELYNDYCSNYEYSMQNNVQNGIRRNAINSFNTIYFSVCNAAKRMQYFLEHGKIQYHMEWIRSDILPNSGNYIVTMKDTGNVCILPFIMEDGIHNFTNVSAWMPLPPMCYQHALSILENTLIVFGSNEKLENIEAVMDEDFIEAYRFMVSTLKHALRLIKEHDMCNLSESPWIYNHGGTQILPKGDWIVMFNDNSFSNILATGGGTVRKLYGLHNVCKDAKPIAWMPMPEAYDEKEEVQRKAKEILDEMDRSGVLIADLENCRLHSGL